MMKINHFFAILNSICVIKHGLTYI